MELNQAVRDWQSCITNRPYRLVHNSVPAFSFLPNACEGSSVVHTAIQGVVPLMCNVNLVYSWHVIFALFASPSRLLTLANFTRYIVFKIPSVSWCRLLAGSHLSLLSSCWLEAKYPTTLA
ncbi:hypothetical protein B0H67DRAFT_211363 [Lasiosphaeris hirsuta]|uniref:Uncharacterized protein n=1 Tax=Lasiosphaeris hirsuta TaxID=260670 RepID=A0AA40AS92_9PEZI|nr:hypothetical protein B0H67DRAFT_211363 [Lasiosphaeris hirsuta]